MSISPRIPWGLHELSVMNTLFALPAMFVFYDFFYCLWHRLLHVRGIYGWIHKHHHRQVRGAGRIARRAAAAGGRRREAQRESKTGGLGWMV